MITSDINYTPAALNYNHRNDPKSADFPDIAANGNAPGGYLQVFKAPLFNLTIPDGAYRLLHVIVAYSWPAYGDKCWLSNSELGRMVGKSANTVRSYLQILAKLGLVFTVHRQGATSEHYPTDRAAPGKAKAPPLQSAAPLQPTGGVPLQPIAPPPSNGLHPNNKYTNRTNWKKKDKKEVEKEKEKYGATTAVDFNGAAASVTVADAPERPGSGLSPSLSAELISPPPKPPETRKQQQRYRPRNFGDQRNVDYLAEFYELRGHLPWEKPAETGVRHATHDQPGALPQLPAGDRMADDASRESHPAEPPDSHSNRRQRERSARAGIALRDLSGSSAAPQSHPARRDH